MQLTLLANANCSSSYLSGVKWYYFGCHARVVVALWNFILSHYWGNSCLISLFVILRRKCWMIQSQRYILADNITFTWVFKFTLDAWATRHALSRPNFLYENIDRPIFHIVSPLIVFPRPMYFRCCSRKQKGRFLVWSLWRVGGAPSCQQPSLPTWCMLDQQRGLAGWT